METVKVQMKPCKGNETGVVIMNKEDYEKDTSVGELYVEKKEKVEAKPAATVVEATAAREGEQTHLLPLKKVK